VIVLQGGLPQSPSSVPCGDTYRALSFEGSAPGQTAAGADDMPGAPATGPGCRITEPPLQAAWRQIRRMPTIVAMPLVMSTPDGTADFVSIKHIPTIAFESSDVEKDYAHSLRSVKILEAGMDSSSSVRFFVAYNLSGLEPYDSP
jgi:hypothetical protein